MNFGILKKVLFLLSADKINLSKEKFNIINYIISSISKKKSVDEKKYSGKEYQMNKIQNLNLKQIKNLMLKKIK